MNSYFKQCKVDMDKMAEKVDDHLQPVPQDIMGSVTRTDPETLRQYEETGRIAFQYSFSRATSHAMLFILISKDRRKRSLLFDVNSV